MLWKSVVLFTLISLTTKFASGTQRCIQCTTFPGKMPDLPTGMSTVDTTTASADCKSNDPNVVLNTFGASSAVDCKGADGQPKADFACYTYHYELSSYSPWAAVRGCFQKDMLLRKDGISNATQDSFKKLGWVCYAVYGPNRTPNPICVCNGDYCNTWGMPNKTGPDWNQTWTVFAPNATNNAASSTGTDLTAVNNPVSGGGDTGAVASGGSDTGAVSSVSASSTSGPSSRMLPLQYHLSATYSISLVIFIFAFLS